MRSDNYKKYSLQQIEPGAHIGDKVVEGWEINDDNAEPWVEYGQRCECIVIYFTDRTCEYAILARWN